MGDERMNAIMTHISGQDYMQRNEAIKRRNAEDAFARHMKYNGDNQKTLTKLEELITGKKDLVEVGSSPNDVKKLDAGQVKQIALPTGKTLEETIDLWRDVRSEAISAPEPTTADYQLAANASAEIRQTEAQIGLDKQAKSETELAQAKAAINLAKTDTSASMEHPTVADREAYELQKRYEQAISSYSFHVQMKENGFEIERPSFYKVA